LFLSPLFLLVPGAATAPALIVVGLFMMSPVKEIDLGDFTEAIPAFLTIIMMPLAYSIAEGLVFGILAFIFIKAISGKYKDITIVTWIVGVFFVLKHLI
jgi:AGZA family xanthine/uracil permease-like MFS transporter